VERPERAAGARAAPAQALYDEGVAHLNAGRLNLAVQRFREALQTSPGDEVIEGAVRRLGPWAG
jgi:outer membrane protein assembly factor BamD (BamD/ComL family)